MASRNKDMNTETSLALELVETHGRAAPSYAKQCIDFFSRQGSPARVAKWKTVLSHVQDLLENNQQSFSS